MFLAGELGTQPSARATTCPVPHAPPTRERVIERAAVSIMLSRDVRKTATRPSPVCTGNYWIRWHRCSSACFWGNPPPDMRRVFKRMGSAMRHTRGSRNHIAWVCSFIKPSFAQPLAAAAAVAFGAPVPGTLGAVGASELSGPRNRATDLKKASGMAVTQDGDWSSETRRRRRRWGRGGDGRKQGGLGDGGQPAEGPPEENDDDADDATPSELLAPLLEEWREVLVKHVLERLGPTDCALLAMMLASNLPRAGRWRRCRLSSWTLSRPSRCWSGRRTCSEAAEVGAGARLSVGGDHFRP